MYEIETENLYKDISKDVRSKFDTRTYPKDHPSGISSSCNNKVLGMFKEEAGGDITKEFEVHTLEWGHNTSTTQPTT